jgi:hypothetical protein
MVACPRPTQTTRQDAEQGHGQPQRRGVMARFVTHAYRRKHPPPQKKGVWFYVSPRSVAVEEQA